MTFKKLTILSSLFIYLFANATMARVEVPDWVLSRAVDNFGFKMVRGVLEDPKHQGKNVFLSPVSANIALSMLLPGTNGFTVETMLQVLQLPTEMHPGAFHSYNLNYLEKVQAKSEGMTLSINNAIWADKEFPILKKYKEDVKKYYFADISNEDFRNNPKKVSEKINKWAADKTNNKIKNIIDAETVTDLVMLLANATYFKGVWDVEFNKKSTRTRNFYKQNGETKEVKMMTKLAKMKYYDDGPEGFKAVRLPFKGKKVSMYVILPPQNIYTLGRYWAASEVLKEDFWTELDGRMTEEEVYLNLPKFKFNFSTFLNDTLKSMGMTPLFDGPCDFTRLSPVPVVVSYVKQDTFIKVDEEGAEAAAVTSIGINKTTSVPRHKFMMVNRPFFIAIRDEVKKSFLFTGFIEDPVWK